MFRHFPPRPGSPKLKTALITAFVCTASLLAMSSFFALVQVTPEQSPSNRPIQVPEDGYVSSNSCRSCHPSEYDTWHGSFHRTMTQVATSDSVRADFDGIIVSSVDGRPMQLERHRDEFWAEFDDPGWNGPPEARPRITRQVVMITGSHHQNIYWYATGHERTLNILPAVYLLNEERWVPRDAVVLHPPNQRVATTDGHWNAICISCHTTNGKPLLSEPFGSVPINQQTVATTATEFGISCEACHGPAEAHVQINRNPIRRYREYANKKTDPTIVQPKKLDSVRSSQVCGQCHGIWEFFDAKSERQANTAGLPYRPGDELRNTRFVAQPTVNANTGHMKNLLLADPEFVRGSFWRDGIVRVSGREYNGLIDSPCYKDAATEERTLTCFSCHSMHKSTDDPRSIDEWADTHQLSSGTTDNAACLTCHETIEADIQAHTNHTETSSGSSCYNCHMPYTSYGLMTAIRSHTITSPTVQESIDVGRPNACNLCHLDQTLSWTSSHLNDWYDIPIPELDTDEQSVAASIIWLMKGDAGVRAITAWHMGWQPAQGVSGSPWMVPFLGELLGDQYDAVRFLAAQSLRSVPGFEEFDYDFVGPVDDRIDAAVGAIQKWSTSSFPDRYRLPRLLFNTNGALDITAMRDLFDERDTTALFLRE